MAGAAGGADLADDGEDDVLGGDAGRQFAVDAHAHVLGLLLDQRLGGEHMLDLGGADAVGQRAERAVGRGVAVAAHDGGAGQGEALLGPDHMDDALAAVALVVILDAEIARVLRQRFDLDRRLRIVDALGAVGGRHVVVDHGQRLLRRAHLAAGHAQALEGLRAGHLVHQMPVDIEQAGAVRRLMHQVRVPDLVVDGAGLGHLQLLCGLAASSARDSVSAPGLQIPKVILSSPGLTGESSKRDGHLLHANIGDVPDARLRGHDSERCA